MDTIDKQMQELYDKMGWGKYSCVDLTRKEYFPETMKTFKSKTVKVTDRIYCDVCGESCTKGDEDNGWIDHEYATIEATWGYWSKQDGTQYNIEMCENCFNEILESIKKKRKKFLGPFIYPFDNDPLDGKSYMP